MEYMVSDHLTKPLDSTLFFSHVKVLIYIDVNVDVVTFCNTF